MVARDAPLGISGAGWTWVIGPDALGIADGAAGAADCAQAGIAANTPAASATAVKVCFMVKTSSKRQHGGETPSRPLRRKRFLSEIRSRPAVETARAADGADHFAPIDPGRPAWPKLRPQLPEMLR